MHLPHESMLSTKLVIRRMLISDVDSVNQILQQLSAYMPGRLVLDNTLIELQNADVLCLVCEYPPHGVVGVGFLHFITKIRGGVVGRIEDIAVKPEFHHCGVGSSIVNHLLDVCSRHNCYCVTLECEEDNIPFYRRLGFGLAGYSLKKRL
jgi:ribosomal protein S18 acetylase RimI-like enzyme